MRKIFPIISFLIILAALFISCKKDKTPRGGTTTGSEEIQIAAGDFHTLILKADKTL